MIEVLALASALTFAATTHGAQEASYVDSSLSFDGELVGFEFVELDAAPGFELVVTLHRPSGRHIQVYAQDGRGYGSTPIHQVAVLEDVIAYGFADVRTEPGRELILVTRTGAYSYALGKPGYRDNIARLVDAPLLFDVPSPRALPHWPYVLESPGGDRLLLPQRDGFAVFGPRATPSTDGAAPYERSALFAAATERTDGALALDARSDNGRSVTFAMGGSANGPLLPEHGESGSLLSDSKGYPAPALVDVNGDGARDLVLVGDRTLRVHFARAGRFSELPDRVEAFPDYLAIDDENESLALRLVELDGDALPDLLCEIERKGDGFADSNIRVLLLLNDGRRLFPERPSQVLLFDAADLGIDVIDANGDGRPDLSMRKFNLPSLIGTVAGLEFTLTNLLFLGEKASDRVVARKTALRQSEKFDENSISDVFKQREFERDCDGDGRPDLVEIDIAGRIAIRRLRFESSFFGGDTWKLDEVPWKRFDMDGPVWRLRVEDLNGDGLGDIVARKNDALVLFMSRRGR